MNVSIAVVICVLFIIGIVLVETIDERWRNKMARPITEDEKRRRYGDGRKAPETVAPAPEPEPQVEDVPTPEPEPEVVAGVVETVAQLRIRERRDETLDAIKAQGAVTFGSAEELKQTVRNFDQLLADTRRHGGELERWALERYLDQLVPIFADQLAKLTGAGPMNSQSSVDVSSDYSQLIRARAELDPDYPVELATSRDRGPVIDLHKPMSESRAPEPRPVPDGPGLHIGDETCSESGTAPST